MEFRELMNIMEEEDSKEYSRGDVVEYYKDGEKCECIYLSRDGDKVKVVNPDDEIVEMTADELFSKHEDLNEYVDDSPSMMNYLTSEYALDTDEAMYVADLLDTGEMTDQAMEALRKMFPNDNVSAPNVVDDLVQRLGHEFQAFQGAFVDM